MLTVNVKNEQLTNLVQLGRDLNAAEKQHRIQTIPPTKKVKNRRSMSPLPISGVLRVPAGSCSLQIPGLVSCQVKEITHTRLACLGQ